MRIRQRVTKEARRVITRLFEEDRNKLIATLYSRYLKGDMTPEVRAKVREALEKGFKIPVVDSETFKQN